MRIEGLIAKIRRERALRGKGRHVVYTAGRMEGK
jgi:hypothetical protein